MYYLRTKPATNAIQFTVDKLALKDKRRISSTPVADSPAPVRKLTAVKSKKEEMEALVCSIANPESCVMCSG